MIDSQICPGYVLSPDRKAITCTVCGVVSRNRLDIAQLFCAQCNEYHEDRALAFRLERELYTVY